MTKTIVDRIPIELMELAKQRSQAVGQSRSQAYRDIVIVAQRVTGIVNVPVPTIKDMAARNPCPTPRKKKDAFDFKI